MEHEHFLQFMTDFHSGYGMKHIMSVAYKYFENPCALYDMNYKPICFIGESDADDRIWQETVHNGGLSESTIRTFMEDNILSPQHKILFPYFEPTFFGAQPGISRRLGIAFSSANKATTTWLVVFEHFREITENDVELCTWFAKMLVPAIDALISKRIYSLGRIDSLMLDILNNADDPVSIEERLSLLGWRLFPNTRVFAARSEEMTIHEPVRQRIMTLIYARSDNVIDLIYNGYLILVFSMSDKSLRESVYPEILKELEKYDLQAGISAPVKDIKRLREYTMQSINCIRIGQRKERLRFFDDHIIDIFLLTASSYFDLSDYCHPFIGKLQECDKENNTDYLNTLRHYVACNGNLKAAAGELGIHRNTMDYRLDKIIELLDISGFDQKLIADLMISFLLFDAEQQ